VKRALVFILFFSIISNVFAYRVEYAEQFYKLYHQHFTMYPEDILENIYYLEESLKAPFVNPLYAMAKIDNKAEWKRYRYLFTLHVELKMIKLYLQLGDRYDKQVAYFYNAPWKEDNLKSLETALECYEYARVYWDEALKHARELYKIPYYHLEEIEEWEDEFTRIKQGDLDYGDIIQRHIERLKRVKNQFENMDENTY